MDCVKNVTKMVFVTFFTFFIHTSMQTCIGMGEKYKKRRVFTILKTCKQYTRRNEYSFVVKDTLQAMHTLSLKEQIKKGLHIRTVLNHIRNRHVHWFQKYLGVYTHPKNSDNKWYKHPKFATIHIRKTINIFWFKVAKHHTVV